MRKIDLSLDVYGDEVKVWVLSLFFMVCGDNYEIYIVFRRDYRGSFDVMNYEGFYIWFYLDCVLKVEFVYNYGGSENFLMCFLDFYF